MKALCCLMLVIPSYCFSQTSSGYFQGHFGLDLPKNMSVAFNARFDGGLNLNNFAASEKVLVSVTNTWGKLMQSQSIVTDLSGNASVIFPLNSVLSRGVYIINTRATSGKLYAKLVVE